MAVVPSFGTQRKGQEAGPAQASGQSPGILAPSSDISLFEPVMSQPPQPPQVSGLLSHRMKPSALMMDSDEPASLRVPASVFSWGG